MRKDFREIDIPGGIENFKIVQQDTCWYKAYWENYSNKDVLQDFSFRSSNNGSFLYFPLMLRKIPRKPLPEFTVQALAQGPSDFYHPFVHGKFKGSLVDLVYEHFHRSKRLWDQIDIHNCMEEAFPFESLFKKFSENGFPASFEATSRSYFVSTTGEFEEYFQSFLKPRNSDLLKDLRRIERNEIGLELVKYHEGIFDVLKDLLVLYAQRRDSKGQVNSYNTSERMGFVKSVLEVYEKDGKAELVVLRDRDNNDWAFQLDWIINGVRYHWNHAYNEEFKKHSPGKILLWKLMEDAFNDPDIVECNHMRGGAGYKNKLANQYRDHFRLMVHNPHTVRNKSRKVYYNLSKIKKVFRFG